MSVCLILLFFATTEFMEDKVYFRKNDEDLFS